MDTLRKKIAFVTGGSRGIGKGIVSELAAAGATVIFTYSSSSEKAIWLGEEIKKLGGKAIPVQADNSAPGVVSSVLESTIKTYGGLDILVNNAGIYIGRPFEEHTLADFDQTIGVNVRAIFETCLVAAKHMKDGGRIINIGSNMADRVGGAQGTLYSMSKSALVGFSKGLARDLGEKNITVNLIQPGPIDTDMNPADSEKGALQKTHSSLKKYGDPGDIGRLVLYLSNPENAYITGSVITIDGGVMA
jgi:3-oxoacyl-[acyl-carrier protein] reductase